MSGVKFRISIFKFYTGGTKYFQHRTLSISREASEDLLHGLLQPLTSKPLPMLIAYGSRPVP